jgi:hypothetical protein
MVKKMVVSKEYWDDLWAEIDKKEKLLQSQVVSDKKKKGQAIAIPTLESSPINNNDLEHQPDIPKEWREAIIASSNTWQPKAISNQKWSTLQKVLAYLFSEEYLVLKSIIAHGWSIADI